MSAAATDAAPTAANPTAKSSAGSTHRPSPSCPSWSNGLPLLLALAAFAWLARPAAADELPELIEHLQQAPLAARDAATARLIQRAMETDESLTEWLDVLPRPGESDDPDIAERFRQVRQRVAERLVEQAASCSTLSLDAAAMPLAEFLEQLHQQTGNQVVDVRTQWGEPGSPIEVAATFKNEPFWPALDKVLDQTGLAPYRFGEGGALGLRSRPPGNMPRVGRGVYRGPFRIEALRMQAVRDLIQPDQSGLVLVLEIAWEPRLEPIALLQPTASLRVTTGDAPLAVNYPMEQLVAEPPPGSISAELALPLTLPDRSAAETLSASGQFIAITPARTAEFRFAELAGTTPVEQTEGGVTVVLQRVAERQGLWEFHMRLKLPSDVPGLEAHTGWAYQNATFLKHKSGEEVDHAGFETISTNPGEIHLAYFFEITEPLDEYVWTYRSPVNITAVRIDYKLQDVPLP